MLFAHVFEITDTRKAMKHAGCQPKPIKPFKPT